MMAGIREWEAKERLKKAIEKSARICLDDEKEGVKILANADEFTPEAKERIKRAIEISARHCLEEARKSIEILQMRTTVTKTTTETTKTETEPEQIIFELQEKKQELRPEGTDDLRPEPGAEEKKMTYEQRRNAWREEHGLKARPEPGERPMLQSEQGIKKEVLETHKIKDPALQILTGELRKSRQMAKLLKSIKAIGPAREEELTEDTKIPHSTFVTCIQLLIELEAVWRHHITATLVREHKGEALSEAQKETIKKYIKWTDGEGRPFREGKAGVTGYYVITELGLSALRE